jgi:hypothetical protein
MTSETTLNPDIRTDRRRRPTRPWDVFRHRGRRKVNRRAEEERRPYFVDRVPTYLFVLGILLLILTLVDGLITLVLLDANCEEANPLMAYLLGRGPMTFMLGKYLLTAIFLPVTMVLNRCFLFGTRFRVGYLFPIFVALYFVLIVYQVGLLRIGGVV